MFCDMPPVPPIGSVDCLWYRPGDWNQDIYTLPLEGLVVTAISQQIPPQNPRWPFTDESANAVRNPSRQPGGFAAALGIAALVPLGAAVYKDSPDFMFYRYLRGFVHSHLWTELFTSSAKVYFGRKRPFYDTVARRGEARTDDRLSFFSGHSSHSFAFATYASLIAHNELKDDRLAWIYTGLFSATASWVAASRAVDRQHNWSDVIVGSLVGTSVGYLTYSRVERVARFPLSVEIPTQGGWALTLKADLR